MGDGSVENPIVLDEEQDKENTTPTTPVSERPTEPPRLLRSRAFGARIENVPDYVYRSFCNKFYRVCVLIYFLIKLFHFIKTVLKTSQKYVKPKL